LTTITAHRKQLKHATCYEYSIANGLVGATHVKAYCSMCYEDGFVLAVINDMTKYLSVLFFACRPGTYTRTPITDKQHTADII